MYIFIHQVMVAWRNKNIHTYKNKQLTNTEAELSNVQTPRLFAWHKPVYNSYEQAAWSEADIRNFLDTKIKESIMTISN